jgi:glutathione-specific gamma-glutamylcyclotransferase
VRDGFAAPRGALWVFGYGSLMWDAGFRHAEARPALLHGYHRAFCVYSHRFRGTQDKPGLVLGLSPGGSCRGMAFRVAAGDVTRTLDELWVREMSRRTYFARMLPVRLTPRGAHNDVDGEGHGAVRVVQALVFVADPAHYAHAGKLAPERAARMIAAASGLRGANADYLHNTVSHLRALGVRDRALERLQARVGELRAKTRPR